MYPSGTSCTPMYLLCLCVPLVPLVPQCTPCMVNLFHHLYGKPPTFTGAGEPLAAEQVQLLHLQHFSSFSPPASLPASLPLQIHISNMHFRCCTNEDTSDHFERRLHR